MPFDDDLSDTERVICEAISARRIISFTSKGRPRLAEPHDFGVVDGERRLFYYQVGGASNSSPPVGWRWAKPPEMLDLRMLDRHFPGPRPVPSGRRHRWARLLASVSRRTAHDGAGP